MAKELVPSHVEVVGLFLYFMCYTSSMMEASENQMKSTATSDLSIEGICSDYLISGPNGVNDNQLTSSSEYVDGILEEKYEAKGARIYSKKRPWCPASTNSNEYVQVDLFKTYDIRAFVIQGTGFGHVTTYHIGHSVDGISWTELKRRDDTIWALNGSTGGESLFTTQVADEINLLWTKHIRILPQTWNIRPCLRFDLIGCEVTKTNNDFEKQSQQNFTLVPKSVDKDVLASALWKVSRDSVAKCGIECKRSSQCKSFAFDFNNNSCTGFKKTFKGQEDITSLSRHHLFVDKNAITVLPGFSTVDTLSLSYKIYTAAKTFEEAAVFCSLQDAKVLLIDSQEIQDFFLEQMDENTILDEQGDLIVDGTSKDGSWFFQTVSAEEFQISSFFSKYPGIDGITCQQVVLHLKRGLILEPCSYRSYFVCVES